MYWSMEVQFIVKYMMINKQYLCFSFKYLAHVYAVNLNKMQVVNILNP